MYKEGDQIPRFRLTYLKITKKYTAKTVLAEKDYSYLNPIMENIYNRALENEKATDDKKNKRVLQLTPA